MKEALQFFPPNIDNFFVFHSFLHSKNSEQRIQHSKNRDTDRRPRDPRLETHGLLVRRVVEFYVDEQEGHHEMDAICKYQNIVRYQNVFTFAAHIVGRFHNGPPRASQGQRRAPNGPVRGANNAVHAANKGHRAGPSVNEKISPINFLALLFMAALAGQTFD